MNTFELTVLAAVVWVAGCAVPQPQNTPVSQRLERDPVSGREYYLYVPSTYRYDCPAPLIVTCHGTPPYDVAEHHIREWKMLGEQSGCIVVAPTLEGTDGIFGDGPVGPMLSDEHFILSIVSQLEYRYNIDRANVMITGFSGGGFPTYWVGLRHPDIFSVVVARNCNFNEGHLDGWYPAEASAVSSVKVYYGENDPVAIQIQSENAIRYLRAKGFAVETSKIPGGHERHPEVAMEFFRQHWKTAGQGTASARPVHEVLPPAAGNTARPAANHGAYASPELIP
jgi:poly(3-hydroxybutyrate) depolymerase